MDAVGQATLEILQDLSSETSEQRSTAADSVVDIINSVGAYGPVLAAALLAARLREQDANAQEAELHALAELCEAGHVSDHLRSLAVAAIGTSSDPSQKEYLEYLARPGGPSA